MRNQHVSITGLLRRSNSRDIPVASPALPPQHPAGSIQIHSSFSNLPKVANGAVSGLPNAALGANGHIPIYGALQESKKNMDLMRKIAQNLTNSRDIDAKLPRRGGNISGGVSFDVHETAVIQPRSVRVYDNRRSVENIRSKSLFDSDAAAKVLSPSSFRRRSAKHFDENKITKDEKKRCVELRH